MILSIETDKGIVSLELKDDEELEFYSGAQRGAGHGVLKDENNNFNSMLNYVWQKQFNEMYKFGVFKNLPANPKIIDVGTGLGILPLILSKYLDNSVLYLIDKGIRNIEKITEYQSLNNNHGFYNSWTPLLDAIDKNNIDINRFNILDPDDNWPENIDLIISTYSWCWHYPRNVYWNKVKNSLKFNGKLFLNVSNWPNENTIEIITNELKSIPIVENIIAYPHKYPNVWNIDEKGNRGYSCMWVNRFL